MSQRPFFSDKGFNTTDGNVSGYNHYVGNANGRIQFTNYYSRISEQVPATGQDFLNLPTVTVTGGGSGLLVATSFTYNDVSYYYANNNDGGTGYAIGDLVKVPGTTFFGGTSPANDLVVQVDSLYPLSTVALDISIVSGTPPTFPEGMYVNNSDTNYWVFKTDGTLQNSGNITSSGNIVANYFIGDGSQLTGISGGGYGNANVADFLTDFGSNVVSTTGNVTASYFSATNSANVLSLTTRSGDSNNSYANPQITMGYAGTADYPSFIHTTHNASTPVDNTIEFWTSDGTQAGTFPANAVLGLTVTNGNIETGNVISNVVITTPVAYSTLTAVAGARAFVNNANLAASGNFGAQVSGGGANTVPVWSDGTNWYIG